MLFKMEGLISDEIKNQFLSDLDELCRMISGFIKSLK